MASITIRNIDDAMKPSLRVPAAMHGRAMEDEAGDILRSSLSRGPAQPGNLAASIPSRFARSGGVELPRIPRDPMREPPSFDERSSSIRTSCLN
jgi:plasmid stability protein